MQNPFETGHIKNYLLLYGSIVIIMILFFIATTLFHDVQDVQKKVFTTESQNITTKERLNKRESANEHQKRFKLLEKSY